MTKRRAEDALFCDAPLKRCARSLCRIDAQSPGMAVAFGANVNPASLPSLAESCRKRAFCSDEQELTEVARPRKKSTADRDNRTVETHVSGKYNIVSLKHSGSFFEEENKQSEISVLNSPGSFSKKRMRDDSVGSENVLQQPDKGTLTDDDHCTFNSFQYWRVPLPEVDLSLLQTNGDAEELSQQPVKDSSALSETDAMET